MDGSSTVPEVAVGAGAAEPVSPGAGVVLSAGGVEGVGVGVAVADGSSAARPVERASASGMHDFGALGDGVVFGVVEPALGQRDRCG